MQVVKCENGHFFDADKHEKCPHCEIEKRDHVNTADSSDINSID